MTAALAAAVALLAVGAAGAGCGSCATRRGTGLYVEIPGQILAGLPDDAPLTLKMRVRALDQAGFSATHPGVSPVLNRLQEIPLNLADAASCGGGFTGDCGISVLAMPAAGSPFDGIPVVVHFTVFANTVEEVADAFEALDNVTLSLLLCGPSLDCAHGPLVALAALGSFSLTIDMLGRDDGDVVLYPLSYGGVDIDPDGDTIPGAAATTGAAAGDTCVGFLEDRDLPWNGRRGVACAAITDGDHMDCNDLAVTINPFEVEVGVSAGNRCFDSANGIENFDQDCDGVDGPCGDADGDGYAPPEDCNDENPDISPGAVENGTSNCSDGVDNDCQGGDVACACDVDGDGYCPTPVGGLPGGDCCEAGTEADCPPGTPAEDIHPGAPEVCQSGFDENCDGTDPPCASPDADGDGHCSAAYDCGGVDCTTATSTGRPVCCVMRDNVSAADLASCGGVFDDCRDWDSGMFPLNPAIVCGDGIDQDCSGGDEACDAADADGDGFTPAMGDCDDANAAVSPAGAEVCGNGLDDNCSGGDVPCAGADADGDTYVACPVGVTVGCDCDDSDAAVHPGVAEACDALDNDCDGLVNEGNPGAGGSDAPTPCYANPPTTGTPYADGAGETWRCRVGRTTCGPDGVLVCTEFVAPIIPMAATCDEDTECNGRNDVCAPCGDGVDVPPLERDLDGDGCLACVGAPTFAPPAVVVGDGGCGGQPDCCDTGTCMGFPADLIYPGAPETCGDIGVDNDCDNQPGELDCVMMSELCDGIDEDCQCDSDFLDPDAQSACTTAGTYCDGSACVPGCDGPADCGASNTCNLATNQCTCGGGPACMAPYSCDGSSCLCGTSVCGPAEICNASSQCQCGPTTALSGEACTAPTAPDCLAGVGCRCGDSQCGPGETCDMSSDCSCAGASAPTGEACTGTTPDCTASGCRCGDSQCGSGETCNGSSDCSCIGSTAATGEACTGDTPDCTGTGCRCGDSMCGAGEFCNSSSDCACGTGPSASTGEACATAADPDCYMNACHCGMAALVCDADETCMSGACHCGGGATCNNAGNAPSCVSGNCQCDSNSACDSDETCVAGECTCGGTSPAAGAACPDPLICSGGACVSVCTSDADCFGGMTGFVCNVATGTCRCDADADCRLGGSSAATCRGGICDCDGGGNNPMCTFGQYCTTNDVVMGCACPAGNPPCP
jgi:hypothetical protein